MTWLPLFIFITHFPYLVYVQLFYFSVNSLGKAFQMKSCQKCLEFWTKLQIVFLLNISDQILSWGKPKQLQLQ